MTKEAETKQASSIVSRRMVRWTYTLVFGAVPLLASTILYHLTNLSIRNAIQNPPELAIFTLVISAAAISDIFETTPTFGWSVSQALAILVLILCVSYSAFLCAFSIGEVAKLVENIVIQQRLKWHATVLAGFCCICCTGIEVWIARKEGR